MGRKMDELAGQRFGNLVAEYRAGNDSAGYAMWVCTCDCGGMHHVRSANLKSGSVTRCKRCSKNNILPDKDGGVTVVDVWVHAIGEDGGFAVARDARGTVLALTPWSRKRQQMMRIPESLELARRALTRLVQISRIEPPAEKEGPKRWCARVGVRVKPPHSFTPWPQLLEQWLASGGRIEDAHPDARPPAAPRQVPIVLEQPQGT